MDNNIPSLTKPCVLTVGTFDGVHIGHQKILQRVVNEAKKLNLDSAVLTFFPHPRMVLQKEMNIRLINTIGEREKIIKNLGINQLVIYPFSKEFSRLTAQEYIEEILIKKLNVKKIIIGYDHRFGRNRTASITELKEFGKKYHFTVEEISKQDIDEVAVSSTKIRNALKEGNIETANKYLGRPYSLSGVVQQGKGLGKKLGFPTANLAIPESYKLIPKHGVYIVESTYNGKKIFGMTNIGTNPTFNETKENIETYFFDLDEDLYGKTFRIKFLKRIRDEKKFTTVEALIKAMETDKLYTQTFIKNLSKV